MSIHPYFFLLAAILIANVGVLLLWYVTIKLEEMIYQYSKRESKKRSHARYKAVLQSYHIKRKKQI
jgi:hypothetical protein